MVGHQRSKRAGGLVEPSTTENQSKKPKNSKSSGAAETPEDEDEDNLALKVFLNSLIMDKIIKHLPLRCLPTLRSTCQLWNNLMVPEYRDRKSNDNPYLVKINNKTTVESMLCGTLNDSSKRLVFSAYNFKAIKINKPNVQKLIDKVGGVMTHLELNLHNLALSIDNFRTLLFNQCPVLCSLVIKQRANSYIPRFWKSKLQTVGNEEEEEVKTLPHLKNISLRLDFEYIKNQMDPSLCFGLLHDLFRGAINLETIKLEHTESGALALNGVILDILAQQEEVGNLHKIQEIQFSERFSLNDLKALVKLSSRKSAATRLGLKEFNLEPVLSRSCFDDPQGVRLMNLFLNLQASSLKKLTVSLCNCHSFTLPIMTSLETLNLDIKYSSPPHVYVNNANVNAANNNVLFLPNIRFDSLDTNFPNLQTLNLMRMEWMIHGKGETAVSSYQAKKSAFMTQLGSHHGITELSVTLDAEDSSSYLVDYASLFPNVKSLTVAFYNELNNDVWSVWPALDQLTIRLFFRSQEAEIDSSITGIPTQSLKLLKSSSSVKGQVETNDHGNKSMKKKELDWKKYKSQPGISDLHQLHGFNIEYDVGYDHKESYMTDLSALYGFIPTANNFKLRKIYIKNFSINFSPEVVAEVEASLGPHGDFLSID